MKGKLEIMSDKHNHSKPPYIPKNDKEQEEKFPGYPPYPSSEDVYNRVGNTESMDSNVEDVSRPEKLGNVPPAGHQMNAPLNKDSGDSEEEDSDLDFVSGNDADVTDEDIENLGDPDQDLDEGDDETVGRVKLDAVDSEGDELDVPGSELDDAMENIGSEDEENNYYSLGSDAADKLEDNPED